MKNSTGFALTASKASDEAKKQYFLGKKSELVLLIIAVTAQVIPINWFPVLIPKITLWISVVSTIIAIFVALLIRAMRLEEIWHETRTLSESAKKLMWLYIIGVSPFSETDPVSDSEFLLALEKLREQSKVSKEYLAVHNVNHDLITNYMRSQRASAWEQRKQTYLDERLIPQINWYTTRASQNSTGEQNLFWGILALEILIVIIAAFLLGGLLSNTSWIGLFTTVTASLYAWGKLNRHQQLSNSYSVIAQQLSGQKSLWIHITTEDALKLDVEKTEEMISRENTNWAVVR